MDHMFWDAHSFNQPLNNGGTSQAIERHRARAPATADQKKEQATTDRKKI